ncbi:MAG: amidohydrolase family protein [Cyanobacteria bacterium J06560_2]
MAESIRLIRGKWVLTGEAVLVDAGVVVQGDTILEVGDWNEVHARYSTASVLGSPHHAILPGLINAHHHSNGVPNSLMGIDDDLLELWLYSRNAKRPQSSKLRTLLSAAYLLKTGVTTVVDVASIGGSVAASKKEVKACLSAYQRAGLRVAFTPGARHESLLVHGGKDQDAAFLATLPSDLQQTVKALTPLEQGLSAEGYLAVVSETVIQYQNNELIDVWFGPPGPQWVGDELLVKTVEAANRLGTSVQTHALESFYEKEMGPKFYGKSVIAHLDSLGVLSPSFSLAHGVWVSESDIEILARTGASISHNPSSNLRLRAGIAPLSALLAGGVTMGLGMDGTTLNDDEDMFTEMRLAARLQRSPQIKDAVPTLEDLFKMATVGGAKLLGKSHSIGKLAPGYKADVVMVNCECMTWPWVAPEVDPLSVVMMRARQSDVDTVMINGVIVLKAGSPTGFYMAEVGQALAAELSAMPDREDYRAFADAVRPYMARWYEAWEVPKLDPYIKYNARG